MIYYIPYQLPVKRCVCVHICVSVHICQSDDLKKNVIEPHNKKHNAYCDCSSDGFSK